MVCMLKCEEISRSDPLADIKEWPVSYVQANFFDQFDQLTVGALGAAHSRGNHSIPHQLDELT